MPKMKTHKGAAKRFTFTGGGKIMRATGRRGHFRRRKALRLLQQLDKMQPVAKANRRMVLTALPYGKKHAR
ncbi:MAG TPA: 50S ribosomal protein L35 [Roseiflexaceae bacterium]|nr:50S ribosomal protein L35 [Roseiflexaceae bacterium]